MFLCNYVYAGGRESVEKRKNHLSNFCEEHRGKDHVSIGDRVELALG